MPMPLEGIRVVDWTIWQQGPVCSMMLADLGAEVIKIEEPDRGDPGRSVTKMSGVDFPDLPNFYVEATNRNKKSLTVDLKTREGTEIIYDLVAKSDVFVQNFRQGVAGRLALVDDAGPFGNPTSDSARTMVTTAATRVLVVVFAPASAAAAGERAAELTKRRLRQFVGADL